MTFEIALDELSRMIIESENEALKEAFLNFLVEYKKSMGHFIEMNEMLTKFELPSQWDTEFRKG